MSGNQLHYFVGYAVAFIAFALMGRWHLWPTLKNQPQSVALPPFLLYASFRVNRLMFLIPGLVSTQLTRAFAMPTAYGDLAGALLALTALWPVRTEKNAALPMVWLFNIVGPLDLIYANISTIKDQIDPTYLSYYLAVINVPAIGRRASRDFRLPDQANPDCERRERKRSKSAINMNLEGHPTVRRVAAQPSLSKAQPVAKTIVDSASLRRLALDCGADDAGLVEITRPGLEPQREEILRNYPWTNCLLSIVLRMAREPVRGTPRSTAVVRTDETLLDAADCAGVFIDNACRSGTCGSCSIKLVSGRVGMVVEDALTTQDKADGYILACQAKVQGDVKVDA